MSFYILAKFIVVYAEMLRLLWDEGLRPPDPLPVSYTHLTLPTIYSV